MALLLGAGALPRAWLRQARASYNNLLQPCKSGFLYGEGNALPSNRLLLQKFAFMQIKLIGVTSHTQNELSKLAGKGKHALIRAGGTATALAALGNRFCILRSSAASKAQLETSPQ